jgi:hypothetical protein
MLLPDQVLLHLGIRKLSQGWLLGGDDTLGVEYHNPRTGGCEFRISGRGAPKDHRIGRAAGISRDGKNEGETSLIPEGDILPSLPG